MPPIRAIATSNTGDVLDILESRGVRRKLNATALSGLTVEQAQAAADQWIANNITGYQLFVHVFSLAPIRLAVLCADLGVVIAEDWWDRRTIP